MIVDIQMFNLQRFAHLPVIKVICYVFCFEFRSIYKQHIVVKPDQASGRFSIFKQRKILFVLKRYFGS